MDEQSSQTPESSSVTLVPPDHSRQFSTLLPVGETLRLGWELYRSKASLAAQIMALPFILFFVGSVAGIAAAFGSVALGDIVGKPVGVVLLGLVVITAVFLAFITAFLAQISIATIFVTDTTQTEVRDLYRSSWKLLGRYAMFMLIMSVISIGTYGLFIIPGFVLNIFFCFASFVVIAEGKRGMEALMTSYAYVSGYFLPIAIRLIAVVAYIFPFLIVSVGIERVFALVNLRSLGMFVSNIISSLVMTPLTVAYLAVIYRNIRSMKGQVAPAWEKKQIVIMLTILGYILLPAMLFGLFGLAIFGSA